MIWQLFKKNLLETDGWNIMYNRRRVKRLERLNDEKCK